MPRLSAADLDAILALQLTVAWAGEKNAQPPRLPWWRTDILDEAGARDLLSRLTPRTEEWAALEAVREAARRVDERTRFRFAAPDRTLTIFYLGFEIDEQLGERLVSHKRSVLTPGDALGPHLGISPEFDVASFERWCRKLAPAVAAEPTPDGGRRLVAPPHGTVDLVRALVSSLVPFASEYPMPHARSER